MQALTLSDKELIREHTRTMKMHIAVMRKVQDALPRPKEWLTYENANKLLDKPKSKAWFSEQRLGATKRVGGKVYRIEPTLIQGQDWKMEGKEVLYKAESILGLKERITK
jgi:hypothetical protein